MYYKETNINAKKFTTKPPGLQDLEAFFGIAKLAGGLREWLLNNALCNTKHKG
jgi:hypothetical protein